MQERVNRAVELINELTPLVIEILGEDSDAYACAEDLQMILDQRRKDFLREEI